MASSLSWIRALIMLCASCRIGFEPQPLHQDATPEPDAPAPSIVYVSSDTSLLIADLEAATVEVLASTGTVALGGLAAWDINTLYGVGSGALFRITVSPFAMTQISRLQGSTTSLSRAGDVLLGVDETTDDMIVLQTTGMAVRSPLHLANGTLIDAVGGDLAQLSNGRWRWFGNTTQTLYELDPLDGTLTPIGPVSVAFVSGLVIDSDDRLYLVDSNANLFIEIDAMTGAVRSSRPVTYDIGVGDATRTP